MLGEEDEELTELSRWEGDVEDSIPLEVIPWPVQTLQHGGGDVDKVVDGRVRVPCTICE